MGYPSTLGGGNQTHCNIQSKIERTRGLGKKPPSLLSLEEKIKTLVSSQASWKGSYTGRISKPYRVGPSRVGKFWLSLEQHIWNLIHKVSENCYILLHRSSLFICTSICRIWRAGSVLEKYNINAQVLSSLRLHIAQWLMNVSQLYLLI